MQPDVLNIETFETLKQSSKVFIPKVLRVTTFNRWNDTVFQNISDTYSLSKIFRNISLLTQFWTWFFLSLVWEYVGTSKLIFITLIVSKVIQAVSNVL